MTNAPAPAARSPARATSTARSRCSTRWRTTVSPTPSRTSPWASPPRSTTPGSASAAPSRTSSPPAPTSAPPPPRRTACSTPRSPRSRSRSARATRSSSAKDEGIRGETTAESLGKLRPAFAKDGTITAGSSSQISDGAAAVVVMSKAKAEELGLEWIAEIGAHGNVAGPGQLAPVPAVQRDRARAGQGGPGRSTTST